MLQQEHSNMFSISFSVKPQIMKLKFSVLFLLIVVSWGTISAKSVDETTACTVASNFFAQKFNRTPELLSPIVAYTALSTRGENSSTPSFYVVNFGSEGFVIVAGDDRSQPILAYSDEGAFVAERYSFFRRLA